MTTVLDMRALQAIKNGKGGGAEGPESADFKANPLHCLITDSVTGETVLECTMTARGFKAKENKKTRQTVGGVGWYQGVSGDDCGTYQDFPVNAGLRVSVDGIKVEPGTPIDLRTDENGDALEGDAE